MTAKKTSKKALKKKAVTSGQGKKTAKKKPAKAGTTNLKKKGVSKGRKTPVKKGATVSKGRKTAAGKMPAVRKTAAKKTVKKNGRPTKFSWAVGERVLNGIAAGQSLTKVCKPVSLPTRPCVAGWVRKGAVGADADLNAFAQGFVLACRVRVALLEDDFVELLERIKVSTNDDLLAGKALKFKLEMDGLKWYLGKFRPTAKLDGVDEALARLKGDDEEGEAGGGGYRFVVYRGELNEA